jgi:hypothetical protein
MLPPVRQTRLFRRSGDIAALAKRRQELLF